MEQFKLSLDPRAKTTRKEVVLDEMNQVVPCSALVALVQPHARGAHQALGGRPPFPIETMLHIHCLQLWWNLSDPAMEVELHERPLCRRFAELEGAARLPDQNTILRFRHLLERAERLQASVRAKWQHPFRVVRQQFGYAKVRYRGLPKTSPAASRRATANGLRFPHHETLKACAPSSSTTNWVLQTRPRSWSCHPRRMASGLRTLSARRAHAVPGADRRHQHPQGVSHGQI